MNKASVLFTLSLLTTVVNSNSENEETIYSQNYTCSNGVVISRGQLCDGTNDCDNWDDECECADPTPALCKKQPCLTGDQEIRRLQLCDGIFDCSDFSDECMCDRETEENTGSSALCKMLLSEYADDVCDKGEFSCNTNGNNCVSGRKICNGVIDCDNGIDEIYCDRQRRKSEREFCRNVNSTNTNGTDTLACACDGKIDFMDGSDEANCTRYIYCSAPDFSTLTREKNATKFGDIPGVYIDWRRAFDGVADCPDVRDEWHDYFVYCPHAHEDHKCNGYDLRHMASPRYAMASRLFLWIQWLVGTVAILANGAVLTRTIGSLLKGQRGPDWAIKRANQILIVSLSASDFLLGVQMLTIAISDVYMRGYYWKYDTSWKSHTVCLGIGFLSITLTQVSVLTVFAISALRLFTLVRPFSTIRLKYVALVAVLLWVIGLFVAKLPTMHTVPEIDDYFIQSVSMPNLPQVDATVLSRTDLNRFVKRAAILQNMHFNSSDLLPDIDHMKWRDLEGYIKNINGKFAGWSYFGYFSHTSMCLPTVLVKMGDNAWEYTFVTVIVDVFAYGFVMVSYIVVMRKTVVESSRCFKSPVRPQPDRPRGSHPRSENSHGDDRKDFSAHKRTRKRNSSTTPALTRREKENRRMQRRIFLLVFTDFICWAPILTMNVISMLEPEHNAGVAKALSFCFVLIQINSMTNPFIYSKWVRKWAMTIICGPCRAARNKLSPTRRKSSGIRFSLGTADSGRPTSSSL